MEQRKRVSIFSIVIVLLSGLLLLPMPASAAIYNDGPLSTPAPLEADLQAGPAPDAAPNAGPIINVWYSASQTFGQPGRPQTWVNILGNVSDSDGVSFVRYSLNGGPVQYLSIGPDTRRLAQKGDFNIDIAYSQLQNGLNEVLITAQDTKGQQSTAPVDLQVTKGQSWPLPYIVDWATVGNLQTAAQVVDGRWSVGASGLHTDQVGYDRMVAIGNTAWADYEVTVPVTIHSIDAAGYNPPSNGPGIGFLLRWQGHTDDPISGWQPKTGWQPFGAIGWYRYQNDTLGDRLQLLGDGNRVINQDTTGRKLSTGVPYIFKMRAETTADQRTFYGLKVWVAGQTEPSGWDVSGYEPVTDLDNGSFALLAHHVEATFGQVTVTPLDTVNLTITIEGSGAVQKDPDRSSYYVGEEVTLTPVPIPGWIFAGWSGPHAGELADNGDDSYTLIMNGDKALTATFAPSNSLTVTIAISGDGEVIHTPGNPYSYGDTALLEPVPDATWVFDRWSGPNAGDPQHNGEGTWSLLMDGDKALTAVFTQPTYSIQVATLGQGQVELTPPQPYTYGQVVTLRPIPYAGWSFTGWGGTHAGELVENGNGTWSILMDGDKSVTARFGQELYLTVSVAGQGSVLNTPSPPYYNGAVVTLQPLPAEGWEFSGWSGEHAGDLGYNGNGTWSITMNEDKAVTATFSQVGYTLSLATVGQGTVDRSPLPPYVQGTVVTLTPRPAAGWRFVGWSGTDAADVINNGNGTWRLTMDGPKALTATFSDQYQLVLDATGQGAISKDPDRATYAYGQRVTLTPLPALGWRFGSWTGPAAAELVENGNGTWSLTMDSDKILVGTFVPGAYVLEIGDTVGEGSVSPPEGTYPHSYGDVVSLSAAAQNGWRFDRWDGPNGDEVQDNGDGTWSLTINGDKSVQARFAPLARTLRVETPIGSGSVEPAEGTHIYYHGDSVILTPLPAPGWSFAGWGGPNGPDVADNGDGTWSLLMDEDKVIRAEFSLRQLRVDVTYQGLGRVRILPGNPYTYGELATLQPLPDAGWIFGGWAGQHAPELVDNGDGTWTLTMDGDKDLVARFIQGRVFLPLIARRP